MALYGLLAFIVIVVMWPFVWERRKKPASEEDRAQTSGDLVNLSQGITHYRWVGPVRGPVAVIVHGLTTPMVGVEGLAQSLGEMGYRVLVYDLYGRGLSDAPRGRQDRKFFLQQLVDLLSALRLTEDITLVGYSMGGAIASAFASDNPHYIKQLILVAPSGVVMTESRFSRFCRKTPILGDWVHAMFGRRHLRKAIPRKAEGKLPQAVYKAQRAELRKRGYVPAVLSSRRGMLSELQGQDHQRLSRVDIPTIAIWAENDDVVPIQALGVMAQWHRDVRQEVVPKAGHGVPYTHPDELKVALVKAMKI